MNTRIDNALKRGRGYWFVDGFIEMTAGGFFVLLAGFLLFTGRTSPSAFSSWFLLMAGKISAIKLIGLVAAVWLVWRLKERFTYPRTGFVRGKHITVESGLAILKNLVLFLLLPVTGLAAVSLLIASPIGVLAAMPVWFPIGLGFLWAGLLAFSGEWLGLRRLRVVAGMILLTGIGIGLWQEKMDVSTLPANLHPGRLDPEVLVSIGRTLASLGYLVLFSGVILIISGLITFVHYRNENPTPYTETV